MDADEVGCRDECGRSVAADDAERQGWVRLQVQRRWRCPHCSAALQQRSGVDNMATDIEAT